MDNQKTGFRPKKYEGISQYRAPLNYELVGRTFDLVMDDGYDCILEFSDRKVLKYGRKDGELTEYAYDCLKADDDTYFVNFEVTGAKPRAGLSFVLDMEQSLVTRCYCTVGQNPKFPKLPKTEFTFGGIQKEDGTVPRIRHGYTEDLTGRAILWHYGTVAVVHVYVSSHYYRLSQSKEALARLKEVNPVLYEHITNPERVYEEPCDYIKIKDGIYLFSMTEFMANRDRNEGNNMLFVMDLNRMHDVGRSFGHNEREEPENYTYGAYGEYYDTPDVFMLKSTEYIR